LRDTGGNLVTVAHITGTTNTLKLQRTDASEAIPDVNVNFLMLVPLASPVVPDGRPRRRQHKHLVPDYDRV